MRRFVDLAVSLLGLILLALPMVIMALVILTVMGSPVLFRQRRCGLRCKPFVMLKFRTMKEARDKQGFPLPDEERLCSLGRFLRRFRLDEVPELWNVLRGDMSLIGPRPLLPETVTDRPRLWSRRHAVRPGLTGWAQVNGNTKLDLNTKMALDLWYVKYVSWRLDFRITYKTLVTLVLGERVNGYAVKEAIELANSSSWYG